MKTGALIVLLALAACQSPPQEGSIASNMMIEARRELLACLETRREEEKACGSNCRIYYYALSSYDYCHALVRARLKTMR